MKYYIIALLFSIPFLSGFNSLNQNVTINYGVQSTLEIKESVKYVKNWIDSEFDKNEHLIND